MIHRAARRGFLLALIVLIIPLLSIQVFAATAVTEIYEGLEIAWEKTDSDGTTTASVSGTSVTFTIKGAFTARNGTNIILTNTSDSKQTLKFDYSVSNAYANGFPSTSGTIEEILEPGASLTYAMRSKAMNGTCTVKLTGITYEEVTVSSYNVGVSYDASLGSVTSSLSATSTGAGLTVPVTPGSALTLTATAKTGSEFIGWINPDDYSIISTSNPYTFTPNGDISLSAVFANSDTAWFLVDDTYLTDDLNYASQKGTKIVLMNNGTLAAGTYTIQSGDTLLIPCDDAHTVYTTQPGDSGGDYYEPTSVFRKLTMANGANITVNGAISIGGEIGTNMTGEVVSTAYYYTNGAPSGPLGYIAMNNGSNITVNSGGNLYAWGFITGSGAVSVKSGGNVYENLQIRDWRGGNCTTSILNNKDTYEVFPFSQYYIQNIECLLTLEAGAVQNVCTAVSYSIVIATSISKVNAVFLGSDSGLIRLSSGSLTRTYDGSTDRIIYDLDGEISFENLSISITISAGSNITINSEDYMMPLNSNMTLNVNSGSNVTVGQDFALLPGAIVEIEDGATVTMGSGKRFIAYDSAQWGTYCSSSNYKLNPVYFAPGRTGTRSESSLVDAKIIVDGTLVAEDGYLYTTSSGANITSNGGGVVKAKIGTQTVTYQITQSGTTPSYPEIEITSAQLMNSDSTYVATAEKGAGTYNYINGYWHLGTCQDNAGDAATCTTAQTCTVCDIELVAALGHDMQQTTAAVAPTCTDTGKTAVLTCANGCGTTEGGATVVATGHTEVTDAAVAATCTATGLTEGKHCSVCQEVIVAQTTVAALGHTEVTDAAVAATCTTTGLTEGKHCSVCNTVIVAQTTVDATGHSWGTVTYTWTGISDASGIMVASEGDTVTCTASRTCSNDSSHVETATATVTYQITTEAGCETTGVKTYTASFETDWAVSTETVTATEAIPVTGHTYEAVVTAPTCTEKGYTTYTCTCGDSYTANEVAANGHTAGEAVKENETSTSYESVVYCSVCGAEISRETIQTVVYSVTISWSQTSTATYTPGTTTYTWSPSDLKYTASTTEGSWNNTQSVMTITIDNSGSTGAVTATFTYSPSVAATQSWTGLTDNALTVAAESSGDATLTLTPSGTPTAPTDGTDTIILGVITITLTKGG